LRGSHHEHPRNPRSRPIRVPHDLREQPLTQVELDDLAALGWQRYATGEPTEHSYQFSYQFRRPIVPSPRVEAPASVGN
jgi:hypothetical protein